MSELREKINRREAVETTGQSSVEQALEQMIARALRRVGYFDVPEANECRRRLALINAKQFLKPAEAAYLPSCSDNHLRNLVRKAKRGEARRPIPFVDLDGTVSFHRDALLKWAEQTGPALTVASEEGSSKPQSK